MQRRHFVASGMAATFSVVALGGCAHRNSANPKADKALAKALAAIEARSGGGRLGVFVYDAASGAQAGYRSDERFPMCSTFKTLLAACVLHLAQEGQIDLGLRVHIAQADVVAYSPVTEKRVGLPGGFTVLELCEAAVVTIDNAAANAMLQATGGPQALTAWLRKIGDASTRLDRNEPSLNEALPGDARDTTTPHAMANTWQALLLGDVLKGYGRALLQQWLVDSRTGDKRVRAGLPADWKVGGKTGSGGNATFGDTLIAWPTEKSEGLLITAYLTGGQRNADEGNAILAQVGTAIGQWYAAMD